MRNAGEEKGVIGRREGHSLFRAARQSKRGDRVEKDETTGVEYVDVTFPMLVCSS